MLQFALVLPAGLTFISLLNIMLFILLLVLLPGSLLIIGLQRAGFRKVNGKTRVDTRLFSRRLFGFVLYHIAMLLIWIISWPQFTNDIHSGYSLTGLPYYLLVMLFWTATGVLLIYAWNLAFNSKVHFPGLGFFVRLFLWNIAIMLVFRQIIYWLIT